MMRQADRSTHESSLSNPARSGHPAENNNHLRRVAFAIGFIGGSTVGLCLKVWRDMAVSIHLSGRGTERESADPTPDGIFTTYFQAAMRHAEVRRGRHDTWFAGIMGIDSVWGEGKSPQLAREGLKADFEFFVLTQIFNQRPLPAFDDYSLKLVQLTDGTSKVLYDEAPLTQSDPFIGLDIVEP